jgi:hypothetical protein
MKSEDFITVAAQIVGFREAGSRSATSRAYYGVFNLAIDMVCEVAGLDRSRMPQGHTIPEECLQRSTNEDARSAAGLIGNLRGRRLKADYRLEEREPDSREYGQYSVLSAKSCERLLNSFRDACRNDAEVWKEFAFGIRQVFSIRGHSTLL